MADIGLHDLLGNVWEWTSTVHKPAAQLRDRNKPKYTAKGGSFMDQNITISAGYDIIGGDTCIDCSGNNCCPDHSSQ